MQVETDTTIERQKTGSRMGGRVGKGVEDLGIVCETYLKTEISYRIIPNSLFRLKIKN